MASTLANELIENLGQTVSSAAQGKEILKSEAFYHSDLFDNPLSATFLITLAGPVTVTAASIKTSDISDLCIKFMDLVGEAFDLFSQPSGEAAWETTDSFIDFTDSLLSEVESLFLTLGVAKEDILGLHQSSLLGGIFSAVTDIVEVHHQHTNLHDAAKNGEISDTTQSLSSAVSAYRATEIFEAALTVFSNTFSSLDPLAPGVESYMKKLELALGAVVDSAQGIIKTKWQVINSLNEKLLGSENGGVGIDDLANQYGALLQSLLEHADLIAGGYWEGGDAPSNSPIYDDLILTGLANADVITGRGGDDVITGNAGNDFLEGRFGSDTLSGGAGNDRLDGGAGIDTAVFGGAFEFYAFDFVSDGALTVASYYMQELGTDTLIDVEYLQFADQTVAIDDIVVEPEDAREPPIPYVHGSINAGFQALNISGSEGFDHLTLDYSGVSSNGETATKLYLRLHQDVEWSSYHWAYINTEDDSIWTSNGGASVSINGFEAYAITASSGDDVIHTENAFDGDDWLNGLAGDDTFYSYGGNDTLIGGEGNDNLHGGNGEDHLDGGEGDDDLRGEAGNDLINGGDGNDNIHGGSGIDTMSGNAGDDTFHGVTLDDIVDGGAGKDRVFLSLGDYSSGVMLDFAQAEDWHRNVEQIGGTLTSHDDIVDAGFQTVNLNGSEGFDHLTLDYSGVSSNGETATKLYLRLHQDVEWSSYHWAYINTDDDSIWTSNGGASVSINGFEAYAITASSGDAVIHTENAFDGDDWLNGLAGDDTFYSYGGNDTLIGGEGNDNLHGGNGEDTAIFDGRYIEYSITVNGLGSYTVVSTRECDAGADQLYDIENLQFADGTLTAEGFVPLTTQNTVLDSDSSKSWESYTDTFNLDGVRISREMIYDDGRHAETVYTDGQRSSYVIEDVENAYAWSKLERFYDVEGKNLQHVNTYDDGRIYVTDFIDGVRSLHVATDHDNAHNWDTRTVIYDENGVMQSNAISYDDGREALTTYTDGVRSAYLLEDLADEFVWTSIERTYDLEGRNLQHTTTYDDGRIYVTDFIDGVRSLHVARDQDDAQSWSSYTIEYDAEGNKVSRTMIYDDGREVVTSYVDDVVLL